MSGLFSTQIKILKNTPDRPIRLSIFQHYFYVSEKNHRHFYSLCLSQYGVGAN